MTFLKKIKNCLPKLKKVIARISDMHLFEKFLGIFNAKSINQRILRLVLISSIGIAALITVSSVIIINSNVHTSVNSEISTMADTYSKYITFVADSLKESISTIGRMSEITDSSMTDDERREYFENLCEGTTFDNITVAGITGQTYEGKSVFSEEYFSSARLGQSYISSPMYTDDGKIKSNIAAQITNGNSAGVVIATVDSRYFSELIAGYKESTLYDGYCFITDKDGKIIAHPDSELVASYAKGEISDQNSEFATLLENMVAAEEKVITKAILNDGKKYYTAYAPIDGYEEWNIAAVIPVSKVTQKIITNLIFVVLLAILLIVGVIIISVIIARSISQPIIDLTGRVVGLSCGDLKTTVPKIHTRDETIRLYSAMNITVDKLNRYISEIDSVLASIADKNLCVTVEEDYHGDFVGIKLALLRIADELSKVMIDIKTSSEQVAYSAREMSDSAMNLANGATEQNDALHSIIDNIFEVAQHAKFNESIAAETKQDVNLIAENVQSSSAVMNDMLSVMQEISNSSNEIEQIISIVEDITFQTNMLSLNASMEAAKAGKYGRGFSVVAEEIRMLAEKCSQVIQPIRKLIDKSVKETENGVRLAGNASSSLNVLVSNVNKTTDAVVKIAQSSEQQSDAVETVKNSLDKIDGVVQANSATAEQTAALAEELKTQSDKLMELVTEFNIADGKQETKK